MILKHDRGSKVLDGQCTPGSPGIAGLTLDLRYRLGFRVEPKP